MGETQSGPLAGKVFLVTGATDGIGKAAARSFVRDGAEVVLVGRNPEKVDRVVSELRGLRDGARVQGLVAELSLVRGALTVAKEFSSSHDRLDVLVNNAGAPFAKRTLTAEGIEQTFALNQLAYFAVTTRLLGLLTKTPGSRVVSTASAAHGMGKIDFDDVLRCDRGYNMFKAYANAKLANLLFTRELARRESGRVLASCFHPGMVASNFGKGVPGLLNALFVKLAPYVGRSPEQGAETLVWLATSEEGARTSGEYHQDKQVTKASARAHDAAAASRLWDLCEGVVAREEKSLASDSAVKRGA